MTTKTNNKTIKKTTKKNVPVVYTGEDKIELAVNNLITNKQIELLASKTPQKYIKKRKGRGGKEFDYVEINYVQAKLNAIFGFNWDVDILDKQIGKNQIWIQIRLTVRLKDGVEVHKDAFGGSEVKRSRQSKEVVDIADDLKAAESDAIKKAASMFGVAWDVYSGITKSANGQITDPVNDYDKERYIEVDSKDAFRDISLTLSNGKKKMVTKFEAYQYCAKVKEQVGEDMYYEILGNEGYEHINQVPDKILPKVYKTLLEAYFNASEAQDHPEALQEPETGDKETTAEEDHELPF